MKKYYGYIFKGIIVAAIIILSIISVNNINKEIRDETVKRLKLSIENRAVECFSIEGFYPDNIEYLIDNYHVTYDPNKYHVYYMTQGANFKPRVEVIERSNYEKE